MKLQTIEDLFHHELKDLYSAENQLVKALPKMAKAVILVANSDRKNTISPTDRFARKKSSVLVLPRRKARAPTREIMIR